MTTTLLRLTAMIAVAASTVGLSVALTPAEAITTAPGTAPGSYRPIIVDVTGDAAKGYGIEYADGDGLYPPTDSEAMAECSEYDRRLDRVRCRVEVRTWYRDLGDMKRSFAHLRGEI